MKRDRVEITCVICGKSREVTRNAVSHYITCGSRQCYKEHCSRRMQGNKYAAGHTPTNTFQLGHTPWNSGLKGFRPSPATEFKKGQPSVRLVPVGTVKIRNFTRSNSKRAFIKIAEPNIWRPRALYVWESERGVIPKGMIVHHKDRNELNDDINNLVLLTRGEHLLEHRKDFEQQRLAGLHRKKETPDAL